LTGTGIQAGTGEREFAEEGAQTDLMMVFVRKWLLTLRTLALVFDIVLDLLCRHDLLHPSQHLFRLIQPQTKRLWC
jgi:hypothetical protein